MSTTMFPDRGATRTWGGHPNGKCPDKLLARYQTIIEEKRLSWTEHHRLIRRLGSGGQGVVYLSERRSTDNFTLPVALKIFTPEPYADERAYDEGMGRIAQKRETRADEALRHRQRQRIGPALAREGDLSQEVAEAEPAAGVAFRQESAGEIRQGSAPLQDPVYFLALCAATEAALPAVGAGLNLFDDAGESVYAHYYHEIRKNMAAGEVLAERERELERLRAELAASQAGVPDERHGTQPRARSWWRRLLGRE